MTDTRFDERHFLPNVNIESSSIAHELGHQRVNPIWNEMSQAVCRGFLSGMAVSSIASSSTIFYRSGVGVSLALGAAVDAYVSDWSKELSYDHEYAREVWEHEYNSIGEVDEYVAYASTLGVTPNKAREIALAVTSEPAVSVPYHLAFELGLTEPHSYHRKLSHATAVALGYLTGFPLSHLTNRACLSFVGSPADMKDVGKAALIGIAILSPVIFVRYKHVLRVPGSKNFKLVSLTAYAATIFSVLAIAKIMKK